MQAASCALFETEVQLQHTPPSLTMPTHSTRPTYPLYSPIHPIHAPPTPSIHHTHPLYSGENREANKRRKKNNIGCNLKENNIGCNLKENYLLLLTNTHPLYCPALFPQHSPQSCGIILLNFISWGVTPSTVVDQS